MVKGNHGAAEAKTNKNNWKNYIKRVFYGIQSDGMNSSIASAAPWFPFTIHLTAHTLTHTHTHPVSFAVNEREKIFGISSRRAKQTEGKLF